MVLLATLMLISEASAQAKKKKASSKKNKGSVGVTQPTGRKVTPTYNLDLGSVGYYFYPITEGSYWKMRTIKSFIDFDGKVMASDTLLSTERVLSNSEKSLQGMPLVRCESIAHKPGQETRATREEVTYYVDDSLIMAVFNNSVSHGENRTLLTSPLKVGTVWPEKWEDSIATEILSLSEPIETPAGRFEDALVTVTRMGYGELVKYFVGEKGIVKMIFRGPAPNSRGSLVVMTDLLEVHHADPMAMQPHVPAHDGQ
jgi:hypothetical protein